MIFVLGLMMLVLLGVGAVVVTLAARRRARQGTLLWLLAIAVEKRLPLHQEVEALAVGLSGTSRSRLLWLAEDLRAGISLPEALGRRSGLVPRFAVLAAQVGGESGTLPQALREAAVCHTASPPRLNLGASSAGVVLLYLWLLVFVTASIVTFLMLAVVPKLRNIFADFDVALPQVTQILIDISGFFGQYFYLFMPLLLLPPLALLGGAIGSIRGWGEFDVPWLGRWLTRFDTPGVLRNVARTVAAGRPLEECLATLSRCHPRRDIRQRAGRALAALERGENGWPALATVGLLKANEAALLESAQRAGNLPWTLRELADLLERRRLYRLAAAVDVVQPAVVITIGFIVFSICIGFFMPLVVLIDGLS